MDDFRTLVELHIEAGQGASRNHKVDVVNALFATISFPSDILFMFNERP